MGFGTGSEGGWGALDQLVGRAARDGEAHAVAVRQQAGGGRFWGLGHGLRGGGWGALDQLVGRAARDGEAHAVAVRQQAGGGRFWGLGHGLRGGGGAGAHSTSLSGEQLATAKRTRSPSASRRGGWFWGSRLGLRGAGAHSTSLSGEQLAIAKRTRSPSASRRGSRLGRRSPLTDVPRAGGSRD